jgi:hypothetical protein
MPLANHAQTRGAGGTRDVIDDQWDEKDLAMAEMQYHRCAAHCLQTVRGGGGHRGDSDSSRLLPRPYQMGRPGDSPRDWAAPDPGKGCGLPRGPAGAPGRSTAAAPHDHAAAARSVVHGCCSEHVRVSQSVLPHIQTPRRTRPGQQPRSRMRRQRSPQMGTALRCTSARTPGLP